MVGRGSRTTLRFSRRTRFCAKRRVPRSTDGPSRCPAQTHGSARSSFQKLYPARQNSWPCKCHQSFGSLALPSDEQELIPTEWRGLRPQQNVIDGQLQRAYTHLLMRLSLVLLFVWLNLTPSFALAASLNTICLNTELSLLVARVGGRVGICVSDGTNGVSLNGGEQFPLYNVVDLPVAVTVLDAVDRS